MLKKTISLLTLSGLILLGSACSKEQDAVAKNSIVKKIIPENSEGAL